MLKNANELLRSAYAIACREGQDTNWDAFKQRVEEALLDQSEHQHGTRSVPAATCTPKTFRLPPEENSPRMVGMSPAMVAPYGVVPNPWEPQIWDYQADEPRRALLMSKLSEVSRFIVVVNSLNNHFIVIGPEDDRSKEEAAVITKALNGLPL